MIAVPKPSTGKRKKSSSSPKLTEYDYILIGEKISDAMKFETEVTITTYRNQKFEKFTGIIKSGDPHTKVLTINIGEIDDIKISANIIVDLQL